MTPSSSFPGLLSLQLCIPLLGVALIWIAGGAPDRARWIALAAAVANLAVSLMVLVGFDPRNPAFQFTEKIPWIPTLNVNYHVGIDGISVPFGPLTALLFIGVILASWNSARVMLRLHFSLLLLLELLTLGVFFALDAVLFFLFWELTLIPVYFLISFWGTGPRRRYAAVKYTLFMLAGGAPLLLGFVMLAHHGAAESGAALTFDYPTLMQTPLPPAAQTTLFFLLLLGFGPKVPLFPFHAWLPTIAMEGAASIAAVMTGLKLGAYGLIRFLIPLTPDATRELHWLLAGLGAAGLIHGAMMALAQTNLRRMLAYASLSHVGLLVLGLASANLQGFQGALFQLANFPIIAGGLFLLTGFLHHRIGSTDLVDLGGAARAMPLLAACFLFLGLASLGLPGTNGFPAELLILISALETHTGAGIAVLAMMGVTAAYFLGLFRKTFLGPIHSRVVREAVDLRPREMAVAVTLGALTLLFGIFPDLFLDLTRLSAEVWVGRLGAAGL